MSLAEQLHCTVFDVQRMRVKEALMWLIWFTDRATDMARSQAGDDDDEGMDPEEMTADQLTAVFSPPQRQ